MSFFDLITLKGTRSVASGLVTLALMFGPAALPAHAESQIAISDEVNIIAGDDGEIVAIGGTVKISGRSDDEIVAIGGKVEVNVQAEDETVIIGGEIDIDGAYAGELVSIGGVVNYRGANTGQLVLVGGEVTVHELAVSGGPAAIFGGELVLAGRFASESEFGGGRIVASGQFADDVKISAKEVSVEGEFYGDLIVEGETIQIKEGAAFIGHLTIRSPNKPEIDESILLQPNAWTYEYIDEYDPRIGDIALSDIITILTGAFRVLMIIVCLTALVAFIVVIGSDRVTRNASAAFRQAPGKSFLIGLATLLITGIVGLFFLVIIVGPLLPLFVGSVGFFIAAYALAAMMFRKVGVKVSLGSRVGYTLVGALLLLVLQIVPILGTLVVIVLSLIGMGAFVMALFNAAPGGTGALEGEHSRGDFIRDRHAEDDADEGSDRD